MENCLSFKRVSNSLPVYSPRSSEINKASKISESLWNWADWLWHGAAENAAGLQTLQIPLSSALLPFVIPETKKHLPSSLWVYTFIPYPLSLSPFLYPYYCTYRLGSGVWNSWREYSAACPFGATKSLAFFKNNKVFKMYLKSPHLNHSPSLFISKVTKPLVFYSLSNYISLALKDKAADISHFLTVKKFLKKTKPKIN